MILYGFWKKPPLENGSVGTPLYQIKNVGFFLNIFLMVKLFEIGVGSYGKIEMDTLALSKTCGCFQGK